MSEQKLGVTECVSMALGGMIGGGIFAVLGVVAQLVHGAAWLAFVLAGVVALCAGHAFNALNAASDEHGGTVTFLERATGNRTLAGMVGWTLLLGYVGSMAMYAHAFGSFAAGFEPVPESMGGLPSRSLLAVAAVAGFVGLNLLGARSTGMAENVMVGLKVLILAAFGAGGLWVGFEQGALETGAGQLIGAEPIMAAALSFVAFQGWQLLYYDQESIADPVPTIRKAVYVSIPAAVVLYVVVAVVTVSLAPMDVLSTHPERALAVAADPVVPHGYTIISLAALFSTGSAINATLFSSAHFAKGMLSDGLLPQQLGDEQTDGLPAKTVLVLGAVTAAFAALGSLGAITAFASLAFIVVFGLVSGLAFRSEEAETVALVPAVGAVGSLLFFGLMFWHLYSAERGTFWAVVVLAMAVVAVELLWFERDELATLGQAVGENVE